MTGGTSYSYFHDDGKGFGDGDGWGTGQGSGWGEGGGASSMRNIPGSGSTIIKESNEGRYEYELIQYFT